MMSSSQQPTAVPEEKNTQSSQLIATTDMTDGYLASRWCFGSTYLRQGVHYVTIITTSSLDVCCQCCGYDEFFILLLCVCVCVMLSLRTIFCEICHRMLKDRKAVLQRINVDTNIGQIEVCILI